MKAYKEFNNGLYISVFPLAKGYISLAVEYDGTDNYFDFPNTDVDITIKLFKIGISIGVKK